ncbi:MAG: hypothetical protein ACLTVC_08385 [Lachnospiraceae bacterium]
MIRLLSASLYRLKKSAAFWSCLIGMLVIASVFMVMQATSMEYTVPLSRVIFLPLSFYGVAAAAMVSVFTGRDFADGFIRNKLIFSKSRSQVVLSQIVTSCIACVLVYSVTVLYTFGTARFFFENNVEPDLFAGYFALGLSMSAAIACLFCVITLLCGDQTRAVVWCMGISFGMLFLSLHTNQILVQTRYKNGALNPHYVEGAKRVLYGILHDLNPCGQAAQLSCWEVLEPMRAVLCNGLWILGTAAAGIVLFQRKDIK